MAVFIDYLKVFLESASAGVVAALIALTGAVFAAIATFLSSRRSIYVTSVTVQRLKWIGEMRENIATLSAHLFALDILSSADPKYEQSPEFRTSVHEVHRLVSLIRLQLNPFGLIDRNVLSILDDLEQSTGRSWLRYNYSLIGHTQWLLKGEWEHVKWEAAGFVMRRWISIKLAFHRRRYLAHAREHEIGKLLPRLDVPKGIELPRD